MTKRDPIMNQGVRELLRNQAALRSACRRTPKLSSAAAQQKSQDHTRDRGDQNGVAWVFTGVVFGFSGNLVKVLALQVLDLVTHHTDLFAHVIAGPRRGIDNLSSILMRIFCKF